MQTKHGTLEVLECNTPAEIADALDWAGLPDVPPNWLMQRLQTNWKLAKYFSTAPDTPHDASLLLVQGETAVELVYREITNEIVLVTAHDL